MADVVSMRALFERLGFFNLASAQVINTQSIDSLEELGLLTDNEVESPCKIVYSPGGEIPNPNTEGAGQPVRISSPGHAASMVAVKNCKLTTYDVCHCNQTMRHVTTGNFTLERCCEVRFLRTQEKNFKDPDASEVAK